MIFSKEKHDCFAEIHLATKYIVRDHVLPDSDPSLANTGTETGTGEKEGGGGQEPHQGDGGAKKAPWRCSQKEGHRDQPTQISGKSDEEGRWEETGRSHNK
jgi:hypothetical protein